MKRKMFHNADALIFHKARELRNALTQSEQVFWLRLKENFPEYKFRRQHPILNYIVDYYCHRLKLIIEIDGPIHDHPENQINDQQRQKELESLNLNLIRFTNDQVKNNIEYVIDNLSETIVKLSKEKKTLSPKSPL